MGFDKNDLPGTWDHLQTKSKYARSWVGVGHGGHGLPVNVEAVLCVQSRCRDRVESQPPCQLREDEIVLLLRHTDRRHQVTVAVTIEVQGVRSPWTVVRNGSAAGLIVEEGIPNAGISFPFRTRPSYWPVYAALRQTEGKGDDALGVRALIVAEPTGEERIIRNIRRRRDKRIHMSDKPLIVAVQC